MKLYFEDSWGERRLLAEVKDEKEVSAIIKNFLDEHNFVSYYTRCWQTQKANTIETHYDVGSHSEFFVLVKDREN